MDGVDDEVATVDGTLLQGNGAEYPLKSNNEMIIPSDLEFHGGSFPGFPSILEGKNPDRGGVLEHQFASLHSMDDAAVMVKELTLQNLVSNKLPAVGTSNNSGSLQTRQNHWQHLYQIAGGLGSSNSLGNASYRDYDQTILNAWEDGGYTVFPELLGKKPSGDDHYNDAEHIQNNDQKDVASNPLTPPGDIRTKLLFKSGFSEYFVKNTLKGKGVICKGPAPEEFRAQMRGQSEYKSGSTATAPFQLPLSLSTKIVIPPHGVAKPGPDPSLNASRDGFSLREWLRAGNFKADKVKSLHIFRQIVDIVDISHSERVVLQDLRPSCFKLLPSNQVIYLGSSVQQEIAQNLTDQASVCPENDHNWKGSLEQARDIAVNQQVKKQKSGENLKLIRHWPQFSSRSGCETASANDSDSSISGPHETWNELDKEHNLKRKYKSGINSTRHHASNTSQLPCSYASDPLEERWYTSPEELSGRGCTISSNMYALGVLLFQLLGSFNSEMEFAAAMSDLRHRVFHPNFLSKNLKEAGLCNWLLHPEPSSRPTAREVLQSDVITDIKESPRDGTSSSVNQDDSDSELLYDFLLSLKEHKQKSTLKLVEDVKCLEADIEEVERMQAKTLVRYSLSQVSLHGKANNFLRRGYSSSAVRSNLNSVSADEFRLTKNISQLESAYFSMRSSIQLSDSDATTCANMELLKDRAKGYGAQKDEERNKHIDGLGAFFSGLSKYARYSKFEVCGILRNGDLHNSANVICSMSFDRDQEYFATAGVSKRIKIFEFEALFNDAVDFHYPVIEMPNKAKFSCICWNSYIRNYLASTDHDGIVKLWDAGTGQGFSQYIEHDRRAWSVDFSQLDPTKLASGSDDCSVKLWNINERSSLCTIRNIANVCSVQFSAHSTHLLAFGSADYKTYCYDLRKVSSPWCILTGHDRAVSNVKFLDSETLVSASTDNTLKVWDLKKTSSTGLSTAACALTLTGHTNEKNFVGLSVADGYIACGSETNEVYAYYRSFPMPITSHKFGSVDPISGKETDDDNKQFVSSVCWRERSDMLVSANSSGCIKVLQMV